jgi:hypothetical protein
MFFPKIQKPPFWKEIWWEFLRMFGIHWNEISKFTTFKFPIIKKSCPTISENDIVCSEIYFLPERRSGYTTKMLQKALGNIGVAKEWPYCIKTKTRKNADRIMHIFADMARERGIEVSSTMNYTVVLEGEAKYLFVSQNMIDRLRGIGYFTDVVEDNEIFAHLQREPSGIVWEMYDESDNVMA